MPGVNWAERVGIVCRRDREIPLGVQLEWGLRSAIVRGELLPGERLPTLRQLAQDVGANLNTIRAVYARLERDGLIDTRHGKGSFVLAQPASSHIGLTTALVKSARAARDAGMSPEQLAAALYVTPHDQLDPAPEAIARRDLRAEIAVLEGALGSLYAQHPDLPVASRPQARRLGPRILDSDELREQRDSVLDRLVEARAVLNEWIAAEAEAEDAVAEPGSRASARAAAAGPPARRRIAPA